MWDNTYKKEKNVLSLARSRTYIRHALQTGNEQTAIGESGNVHPGNGPPLPPPPSPQAPWQNHHVRVPWGRPPPIPREGEHPAVGLPPINMPPPQIRPRGRRLIHCRACNPHLTH